jgi:predicted RecB family nuclease
VVASEYLKVNTTTKLSKSKILAFRQCPKKLWLEIHQPSLKEDSAFTQTSFEAGQKVGEIARQLFDPKGRGQLIEIGKKGVAQALAKTEELLTTVTAKTANPVFEAAFEAQNTVVFADAILPQKKLDKLVWRMVEVKASTRVKESHRDDIAVQAYIAKSAGMKLHSVAIAHIDGEWTYPGANKFNGLLKEEDFTKEVIEREPEVAEWITKSLAIAEQATEPVIATGRQCNSPVVCGFQAYCGKNEVKAQYPISLMPGSGSPEYKTFIATHGVTELKDVPDKLLSMRQLRVKQHTLNGTTYFDAAAASTELKTHTLPAYFLDFESIQFAIPIWKSTKPYQQMPFQFSLHTLSKKSELSHQSFLDLSGKDPSKAFAQALAESLGATTGPIYVYNAAFERSRIVELATRYAVYREALMALTERLVDLLKIAEKHYYHPDQKGSWSIKKVLPTIAPDLRYDALEGVQDGGMAMTAYAEAIAPATTPERKAEIELQLQKYCELDTLAMVRIWSFFSGKTLH